MPTFPHSVKIEGVEGGWTNRNRAKRFIAKKRAEWVDAEQTAIRFLVPISPLAAILSAHGPRLEIGTWKPTYRNTEAPVLQPSIEWLRSRRGVQGA